MSFLVVIFISIALFAQAPSGYYNAAVGKKKAGLKTSLFSIIKPHTMLEYYSSSTSFRSTDWHPDGYFWDMYSSNKRSVWSGMNREHNMPKSWFGIGSDEINSAPIATDLHNLYPSDATANSAKSNYPLGVVSGTPSFSNGVVKVGANSFPGYVGTVFEPANEYKGDFARDYMYMVTCYEDYAEVWQSLGTSSMLNGGTYPVFKTYGIDLLLKWHREDSVSSKEINRNNAVYSLQNNRNPFVDFPILAEYIWGKLMGESWPGSNNEPKNFYLNFDNTTNKLFVSVTEPEKTNYRIYSISGVILLTGKVDKTSMIDVNKLEKGMYIAVVYASTKRLTAKFLKW